MKKEIELLKNQVARQKAVLEILMRQATSGGITFEDSRYLREVLGEFQKEDEEAVEAESVNV